MAAAFQSIRVRVIAAVMALTILALTVSGVVLYLRGDAETERRVLTDLEQAVVKVEALAGELDPATGQSYASAEVFLRAMMRRTQLTFSESAIAIVGGALRWEAPTGVVLRPEDDPTFMATVLPLAERDYSTTGRLTTSEHDYFYIVVPVKFATGPNGALVRVYDLWIEKSPMTTIYLTYALVALGSVILVAVLIGVLIGRLLEPIATLRETAEHITETDLTQRVQVRGKDELASLSTTLNGMLDRLELAVNGQRDLLDDVGHELRTPLAIVRGNLELMNAADPSEVEGTRTLVIDEVDRMHRLVDDLLTLAKAERPEFLQLVSTDIARLTDETLAKAVMLGDRKWVLDKLADQEVVLDPQRITQAWLQLAANAVQYSDPGSMVGMGSEVKGQSLLLWVRDEGIGIPEEEREQVLERKIRGRNGSGTGLGLAIVSSLARVHQGSVKIESVPGVGSRFTMILPIRPELGQGERESNESHSDR